MNAYGWNGFGTAALSEVCPSASGFRAVAFAGDNLGILVAIDGWMDGWRDGWMDGWMDR